MRCRSNILASTLTTPGSKWRHCVGSGGHTVLCYRCTISINVRRPSVSHDWRCYSPCCRSCQWTCLPQRYPWVSFLSFWSNVSSRWSWAVLSSAGTSSPSPASSARNITFNLQSAQRRSSSGWFMRSIWWVIKAVGWLSLIALRGLKDDSKSRSISSSPMKAITSSTPSPATTRSLSLSCPLDGLLPLSYPKIEKNSHTGVVSSLCSPLKPEQEADAYRPNEYRNASASLYHPV